MPLKAADDLNPNEDFQQLVLASKLPRLSKFIEQYINFWKSFCKQLMNQDIVKSDLLRCLSAFDSPVILESPEDVYTVAIEQLSSHFVSVGIFSSNDKVRMVSQYQSLFVSKVRTETVPEYDDWILFIATHYEIQCGPKRQRLFKHSCACSECASIIRSTRSESQI